MIRKLVGGALFVGMVLTGAFIGAVLVSVFGIVLFALVAWGQLDAPMTSNASAASSFFSLIVATSYVLGTLGGAFMGVVWARGMLRH